MLVGRKYLALLLFPLAACGPQRLEKAEQDVRGQLYPAALPRSVAELSPDLIGKMYGPESAVFRVSRAAGSAVPVLLPRLRESAVLARVYEILYTFT